ncbi:MAG TPA: SPOR domain-containing protein [Calditrichia bacterium]|nr:SPOR domain-containing protein [Calditrichia bacterium]
MIFRLSMHLLLAGILLSACSSSSKTISRPVNNSGTTPATRVDESFDPLELNDEDISFPVQTSEATSPDRDPIQLPDNPANREIDGFRVQLFATREIERATSEKKQAEYQFANTEQPAAVYILFDSPMWKVRVGDCRDRESAEVLRQVARENGYSKAFIVKDKVNTAPSIPIAEELDGNF